MGHDKRRHTSPIRIEIALLQVEPGRERAEAWKAAHTFPVDDYRFDMSAPSQATLSLG